MYGVYVWQKELTAEQIVSFASDCTVSGLCTLFKPSDNSTGKLNNYIFAELLRS